MQQIIKYWNKQEIIKYALGFWLLHSNLFALNFKWAHEGCLKYLFACWVILDCFLSSAAFIFKGHFRTFFRNTVWWYFWNIFLKTIILIKISRRHKILKNFPACKELKPVYLFRQTSLTLFCSMGGSRGGTGGPDPPPPPKNHKNIGFLSNTGPDPLKIHKATKPACNVGPPSAR